MLQLLTQVRPQAEMQAHSPTIAFTVRELTGTQIEIETLSTNHTVGDLLQAIMAATEGDSKLRLVYEELPLDDESQTLGIVGIREGSEVFAVPAHSSKIPEGRP